MKFVDAAVRSKPLPPFRAFHRADIDEPRHEDRRRHLDPLGNADGWTLRSRRLRMLTQPIAKPSRVLPQQFMHRAQPLVDHVGSVGSTENDSAPPPRSK